MRTINIVLKAKDHNVTALQDWLDKHFELISYKFIIDTEELYQTDSTFRNIIKEERRIKRLKSDYIYENNNR